MSLPATMIATTTHRLVSRRLFATGAGIGNVRDRILPTAQPHGEYFRHTAHPRTCSIIGAPMTYGQPFVGTDSSPSLLREAGLREHLSALGWRVEDLPDLDFSQLSSAGASPNPKAKNLSQVAKGNQMLQEVVESKMMEGRFPLVLGGDHSIGIGSLAGILCVRPETGVLWIDAHADLNTPAISESGNMHGMPLGLLVEGVTSDPLPGLEWLASVPKLRPEALVYVGLRDVDPLERMLIQELGICAFTMHEIDRYGIGHVMELALEHLAGRPLHLSYDIDAVDPLLAPATGTTVRGGLTYREAHYVAEAAARSGNLASAEVVELNPTLSHDEGAKETVELGLQIITSLMGKSII